MSDKLMMCFQLPNSCSSQRLSVSFILFVSLSYFKDFLLFHGLVDFVSKEFFSLPWLAIFHVDSKKDFLLLSRQKFYVLPDCVLTNVFFGLSNTLTRRAPPLSIHGNLLSSLETGSKFIYTQS